MKSTATVMTVLLMLSGCSSSPAVESVAPEPSRATTTMASEADQRAAWCSEPESAEILIDTIEMLKASGHGSVTAAVRKIDADTATMSDDADNQERSTRAINYLMTDWAAKHTGEWETVCRTAYENR
jgi:uncharacterized protein YceK